MKKLIKYFLILAGFSFMFSSCEDFLNVNEDPDSPASDEITEATTLPGLLGRWAYNGVCSRTIDAMYMTIQWVRVGAQPTGVWGNYLTPSNAGDPWNLYTGLQKHANKLMIQAEENGNSHYKGIAEVMLAWGWATLTDHYGPIPLNEAFMFPEIMNPSFESQETVYAEVFNLLDDAITNLSSTQDQNLAVRSDDLVYEGDISKWIKLAYSLKARYEMRLSYAPNHTTTAQADAVLAALGNGMASNDDDALFRHYAGTGFQSGYYEHGPNWTDVQRLTSSVFMVDTMNATNDPRLEIYFDREETGQFQGWVSGTYILGDDYPSYVSNDYCGPTYPETFMNYVECKMLEAEAYALKSDFTNAESAWEGAVTADMGALGIDSAAIASYIGQFTFPTNTEDAQAFIIMQKYVANFITNFEMLFDYIRTGYPDFPFLDNNVGAASDETTPRRWPYPTDEAERNSNCPDNTFNPLTTKVWWDNK